MKNATIATAFIAIAGIALGQGVSDSFSGKEQVVAAAGLDLGSQPAAESTVPAAAPPAGSGILIGRSTWAPAGTSAQLGGGVRFGHGAATQPGLGRGLAFDGRREGGKPDAL